MPKEPVTVKITVRLVEQRGPSAVVEYARPDGSPARAILPAGLVQDGAVEAGELELGIPYGLPWEEICQLAATPAALADALRRAGIWTLEDLRRSPKAAAGAIQAVYGLEFAALIRAAENYQP